jgi:predicted metal-dependent phosphoesterase TrpH
MSDIRVELHCHSIYSKDSNLPLEKVVEACGREKVDVIALTDHNEIAGALKLREMAPDWLTVIVGEEIATADGDLVGMFLTERIEARLPIEETIRQIRAQGGLAIVPHPFDRLRHEAMGGEVLERVKDLVDFVEIYNSRCLFGGDNDQAAAFVLEHGIAGCVGCDAHWSGEHGNAIAIMEAFDGSAADFADKLRRAEYAVRPAGVAVHVGTAAVQRLKRMGIGLPKR